MPMWTNAEDTVRQYCPVSVRGPKFPPHRMTSSKSGNWIFAPEATMATKIVTFTATRKFVAVNHAGPEVEVFGRSSQGSRRGWGCRRGCSRLNSALQSAHKGERSPKLKAGSGVPHFRQLARMLLHG